MRGAAEVIGAAAGVDSLRVQDAPITAEAEAQPRRTAAARNVVDWASTGRPVCAVVEGC